MKKMILIGIGLLVGLLALQSVFAQNDALVIDDFESGVPFIEDEFNNGLGLVPWGNLQGNVTLGTTQVMPYSAAVLPNQAGANTVLTVSYEIDGWGGFSRILTDGDNWISEDWSAYDALAFWLYGTNTGAAVQIDLFDNRAADSTGDSAERWFYRVTDDYSGWREFMIPFAQFQRRTDFQPSGAPDDGLGLTEVSGYAFGFPAGVGAQVTHLDNVRLVGEDYVVQEQTEVATEEAPFEENIVENWELVWADEFEGEAGSPPNPENWLCEVGGEGWGNNEWQYYTERTENAVLNGKSELVITAREENPDDYNCWYGDCTHTSARCITRGKVEFEYGRIEARIKVPYGQGIWPAFWMLGSNFPSVGWPRSGEIDIMENIGREPNTLHGTVHGPGYSGGAGLTGSLLLDEPLADDYHVYAIEWFPNEIRWYFNDQHYHTLTPQNLGGNTWAFDQPFFLLLNVAVGGNWPGYPDETTVFPQQMLVDYVRWYQSSDE